MTDNLLEQGISAALTGRREEARALLAQVVEADERNEQAWLWLSGLVEEPEEIRTCLEMYCTSTRIMSRPSRAWPGSSSNMARVRQQISPRQTHHPSNLRHQWQLRHCRLSRYHTKSLILPLFWRSPSCIQ
jgi:hypothetical protein